MLIPFWSLFLQINQAISFIFAHTGLMFAQNFDGFMAVLVHIILKLSMRNHYIIIKLLRNFQLNSSKFGNSHHLTYFLSQKDCSTLSHQVIKDTISARFAVQVSVTGTS